jgi:dTDP-4-dehydrorhamnose reductase
MNILVIGSGGQLGRDCVRVLNKQHQVTGLDFPEIDICSQASLAKALDSVAPEAVVNCAAYTAVDLCESEQEAAWRINAEGPAHLADCALSLDFRLFHVSTDYVFDGNKPIPSSYLEDDPVNPLSEYGRSKLAGEEVVLRRAPASVILRTAWLYSAHGPNFLKTILKLALSDPRRNFTIVNDQFGSLTWSYTLAQQIEYLLDSPLTGIIHTTSENYSSWYQAACYFLERMEVEHAFVPCTTEEYPTPAVRPKNSILENRVLKNSNYSIFRSWQEDVDRFVAAHREALLEEAVQSLEQ